MRDWHRFWRHIALVARSLTGAVALGFSTAVGLVAAFAALVPPALEGGPEGRRPAPAGRARPHGLASAQPPPPERTLPPPPEAALPR
jgi:hypothetical protein